MYTVAYVQLKHRTQSERQLARVSSFSLVVAWPWRWRGLASGTCCERKFAHTPSRRSGRERGGRLQERSRPSALSLAELWPLIEGDIRDVDFARLEGQVDVIGGAPPTPPTLSVAGALRRWTAGERYQIVWSCISCQ
jgi:hypothetical protein